MSYKAAAVVRPLAEAGVTRWLENVWAAPESTEGVEGMRARVRQGHPEYEWLTGRKGGSRASVRPEGGLRRSGCGGGGR